MARGLRLRDAGAQDVEAVAALINSAFAVERSFVDGNRTDPTEVRGLLEPGCFLVVDDGAGELLGCVYLEVRGSRGYFGLLAVDPASQGAGIGRWLVDAAEEHCRKAGCAFMDLQVVDLREELPPFYSRLGYAVVGTAPFEDPARLERPCQFIRMSKPLG